MNTPTTKRQDNNDESINWEEIGMDPPANALELTGDKVEPYHSPLTELRVLHGVSLLRLHSLQTPGELNAALAPKNVQLPEAPLQSLGPDPKAMSLAPGEWLLFSEFLDSSRLLDAVLPAIDSHQTSVLDLSPGHCVFRLTGSAAPWLLAKLSKLDFFGQSAGAAYATRTRMQHVAVTLHYHSPGGHQTGAVFDLICERSTALYLWNLLIASIPHAEQLQQQFGSRK